MRNTSVGRAVGSNSFDQRCFNATCQPGAEAIGRMNSALQRVQAFESEHGASPDVVYINPSHYQGLHRYHAEIFESGQSLQLGFQLVILPGSLLPTLKLHC